MERCCCSTNAITHFMFRESVASLFLQMCTTAPPQIPVIRTRTFDLVDSILEATGAIDVSIGSFENELRLLRFFIKLNIKINLKISCGMNECFATLI